MATTKKRIHISIARPLELAVKRLAARDQMPIASKAAELIRLAIEIEEDYVLDMIASERMKKDTCRISHTDAWK